MALFIPTANPEDLYAHSLSTILLHMCILLWRWSNMFQMFQWKYGRTHLIATHRHTLQPWLRIFQCRSAFHAIKARFWISKMPILFGTTIFGAGIYMGYVELINMDTDTNLTRSRLRRLVLWHLQFTVAVHGDSKFLPQTIRATCISFRGSEHTRIINMSSLRISSVTRFEETFWLRLNGLHYGFQAFKYFQITIVPVDCSRKRYVRPWSGQGCQGSTHNMLQHIIYIYM